MRLLDKFLAFIFPLLWLKSKFKHPALNYEKLWILIVVLLYLKIEVVNFYLISHIDSFSKSLLLAFLLKGVNIVEDNLARP